MYDWLNDARRETTTVVTASRRLARSLQAEYAVQQRASGRTAWRTPAILAWQDWLVATVATAPDQTDLPVRLNGHQSQWLWERCLARELEAGSGLAALVRSGKDTWQSLQEFEVAISEVAAAAQTPDQRMYVTAAGRYMAILDGEHWVDDAGLGKLVLKLLSSGQMEAGRSFVFAGFDRPRPVLKRIQAALQSNGCTVKNAPASDAGETRLLQAFDSVDSELRAAGAWARSRLDSNPSERIAIVVTGLENDAEHASRLVREGMVPGWQYGHSSLRESVNVSYGRSLKEFPAVAVALLQLRWLVEDISSLEVGLLMKTPLLGATGVSERCAAELHLRNLPDRRWSPAMVTSALRRKTDANEGGVAWWQNLASLSARRRALPRRASPADWAVYIDDFLRACGWPGEESLDSRDFQLINRWRELLNEFARLQLVAPRMGFAAAIARIELMASETIFQAESKHAALQLLGPLEATGAQFDSLWVCGVTTNNWPPASNASVLVSRRLQQKYKMPDASPGDTLQYARGLLQGFADAAPQVVFSYAANIDDAEQTPSNLLAGLQVGTTAAALDPGWHAQTLTQTAAVTPSDDCVPAVTATEEIGGGAATVQLQVHEPIAAFIQGRMHARRIYPQAIGITPPMRGNMIHDALYKMYLDLPGDSAVRSWVGSDLEERVADAVEFAVSRHERNADRVLQQLLLLERARVAALLRQFVEIDGQRGQFTVASVEGKFEFVAGKIHLPLRFDRIDALDGDCIAILDYKTGAKKTLLNRKNEVQELQLFVYACATDANVSALALVNIDSREIDFDGAGKGYRTEEDWPQLLAAVKSEIAVACASLEAGDVRINVQQGVQAARPFNLLTRYTEVISD
ncbi:MAG: PD-(D/E)XK nuclease family protein [Gammaproteobacteria bacterium]|nr:PD-(D/E)XK nuclease family protein [Gammaproteobacteria bacterium]